MPTTLLRVEHVGMGCVEASFGVDRDDGKRRLHTVSIPPNIDVETMMAMVADNFQEDGDPPISAEDVAKIKSFADPYQTQDNIAAYVAQQELIQNRGARG